MIAYVCDQCGKKWPVQYPTTDYAGLPVGWFQVKRDTDHYLFCSPSCLEEFARIK
jgi:hypothetical protein